jgi:hypothetical protein
MCSDAQKQASLKWKKNNIERYRIINNKNSKAYDERKKDFRIERRKASYQYKKVAEIFRNILLY